MLNSLHKETLDYKVTESLIYVQLGAAERICAAVWTEANKEFNPRLIPLSA